MGGLRPAIDSTICYFCRSQARAEQVLRLRCFSFFWLHPHYARGASSFHFCPLNRLDCSTTAGGGVIIEFARDMFCSQSVF